MRSAARQIWQITPGTIYIGGDGGTNGQGRTTDEMNPSKVWRKRLR
jgi:hypothetical protein